jgi:hypothetical protein
MSIIHEKSPRCIGHLENFEISHLSNLFASLVAQGSAKQLVAPQLHKWVVGLGLENDLPCLMYTLVDVHRSSGGNTSSSFTLSNSTFAAV